MRGLHRFAALTAIGIHATDTHTDPETASNAISQKTCPDQQFSCDNGQTCLDLQAVCDGISDCKDKSDEANCSNSKPKQKPTTTTENSNNSPEDEKKNRLRRQFPDYSYDLYDGFDFPSTDFPLLDYGTTDTLDLFGDFNFETTPNPLFGFGGLGTTAMPLFGGGFTTAIPSFGIGTTAIPGFNLATTEAAFPIFATPTPGFAVETTPMLDNFGFATTAPSFPGLPTTAAFDFGFGPQTTTASFEFGAPTTSLVTTAVPFGAPTTTMADFGPLETTPLSLLQTTEPEFATTAPPTTEPLLQFQQTTQPLDILDINTTMEPTTQPRFVPTTQPIQPPTTAGLLPLQTTTPAGMLCSDGSTVPLDKICDGFNDCPGGDDEGEASNCPVILPLTTAPDLDFGLPTTAVPDLFATTADPFGPFDPFDPSFLQTTDDPFLLQTTAPSFIFQTTQAPSQFTTDGFGFGNLGLVMTTEPEMPQTTQYYQQQTTDSISFNEVNFNNIPNPPAPTRSTTQTPMMTKPPSVEAMGEYGEENFARFVASFEIWRENVFDKWLSTAKTYKQRAIRDQGPPKSCPKQGRDSCANGRRTCTDDLDGCLYCYCRIDQKKDTHEAVVREYEEDIKFWKDVLEPQWKEMWEQWEDQWEEYERDEL